MSWYSHLTSGTGYLTVGQTAKYLQVSRRHVLNMIRRGQLPAINIARGLYRPDYRISIRVLDDWGRKGDPPLKRDRGPRGTGRRQTIR